MKTTSKLFLWLGLFYIPLLFIYGYFTQWEEPVGTVGLALSAGFGLMIAGYIAVTTKKLDAIPADDADGEISDISGNYGFYSPHSWWPIALAAAVSLFALGVAVGWWMVIVATPLVPLAVVGWVFEYFRGADAV